MSLGLRSNGEARRNALRANGYSMSNVDLVAELQEELAALLAMLHGLVDTICISACKDRGGTVRAGFLSPMSRKEAV